MTFCTQCGAEFTSHSDLKAHLLSAHGRSSNPVPRSLPNLYEIVERLEARVETLEALRGVSRGVGELREDLEVAREIREEERKA